MINTRYDIRKYIYFFFQNTIQFRAWSVYRSYSLPMTQLIHTTRNFLAAKWRVHQTISEKPECPVKRSFPRNFYLRHFFPENIAPHTGTREIKTRRSHLESVRMYLAVMANRRAGSTIVGMKISKFYSPPLFLLFRGGANIDTFRLQWRGDLSNAISWPVLQRNNFVATLNSQKEQNSYFHNLILIISRIRANKYSLVITIFTRTSPM